MVCKEYTLLFLLARWAANRIFEPKLAPTSSGIHLQAVGVRKVGAQGTLQKTVPAIVRFGLNLQADNLNLNRTNPNPAPNMCSAHLAFARQ